MNFEWMKAYMRTSTLFSNCREAEEFVLARPVVSAVAARRAMETVVKEIYQETVNGNGYAETVYEMVSDSTFRSQIYNSEVINAIHTVRRTGNNAAHNGEVSTNEAMRALEALHKLMVWYGKRGGLLQNTPAFVPPKPDRIQEIMQKIPFENFSLRIEPYIHLNGDASWLAELKQADVQRLVNLPETPDAVRIDAFYRFLEQFVQSKELGIKQILELLPLSAATEQEWEARRGSISPKLISEVDAFVNAMSNETRDNRTIWRKYADTLGDKAGWYLQLAHPEIIPASMRSGFVLPETQTDSDSYIPLEEAVEQMLREIASGNDKKARLMCNKSWCREYLGMDVPVLIPLSNNLTVEERQKYSKKALHVGNRKYFHLLNWDRKTLFAIRSKSGEVGEKLVTIDRMADWGFTDPGSTAAQRAKERAKAREMEEAARQAEINQQKQEAKRLLCSKKPETEEVPPKKIREEIERMPGFHQNVRLLTLPEWCKKHISIDEPVLLSLDEWIRLRRKLQIAGKPLSYSVCMVDIGNSNYVVRRMNNNEFDTLLAAMQDFHE